MKCLASWAAWHVCFVFSSQSTKKKIALTLMSTVFQAGGSRGPPSRFEDFLSRLAPQDNPCKVIVDIRQLYLLLLGWFFCLLLSFSLCQPFSHLQVHLSLCVIQNLCPTSGSLVHFLWVCHTKSLPHFLFFGALTVGVSHWTSSPLPVLLWCTSCGRGLFTQVNTVKDPTTALNGHSMYINRYMTKSFENTRHGKCLPQDLS